MVIAPHCAPQLVTDPANETDFFDIDETEVQEVFIVDRYARELRSALGARRDIVAFMEVLETVRLLLLAPGCFRCTAPASCEQQADKSKQTGLASRQGAAPDLVWGTQAGRSGCVCVEQGKLHFGAGDKVEDATWKCRSVP